MENTEIESGKADRGNIKSIVFVIIIAILALVAYWQGWYKYVSVDAMALSLAQNREFLQSYVENNYVYALLIYIGIYIVAVALSFPGATFLTLAGGLLFNWHIGGVATILAATIGATIIFLIAKTAVGEQLSKKAGPFVNKLQDGFRDDALNYMLFLRLVPVFPFWLINIAPALLNVSLPVFFIGTLIGIIPGTFAFCYAGVGIDSVIDAQLGTYQACIASGKTDCVFEFSLSGLVTQELIIAFVLLGIVSIIPVILKKLKKSK